MNIRETLSIVAFPTSPEERDAAWSAITREFSFLSRKIQRLEHRVASEIETRKKWQEHANVIEKEDERLLNVVEAAKALANNQFTSELTNPDLWKRLNEALASLDLPESSPEPPEPTGTNK